MVNMSDNTEIAYVILIHSEKHYIRGTSDSWQDLQQCYALAMVTKAALLLFRVDNGPLELLFVRPRGKPYFIFPGGKQEVNEDIRATLQRELQEELGSQARAIRKLGVVSGVTPDGHPLTLHLYLAQLTSEPSPQAEIAQLTWFTKQAVLAQPQLMTPMTLDHVMPFLEQEKIW